MEAYANCPNKDDFFSPFFERLAGTNKIRESIVSGADAEAIRALYSEDLMAFKKMRRKYLLYP